MNSGITRNNDMNIINNGTAVSIELYEHRPDEKCQGDKNAECQSYYQNLQTAEPCSCGSMSTLSHLCCQSMEDFCPNLPPKIIFTEPLETVVELAINQAACAEMRSNYTKLTNLKEKDCMKSRYCGQSSRFVKLCNISGLCDDTIYSSPDNMVPATINGHCANDFDKQICEAVYSMLRTADACFCGKYSSHAAECCVTAGDICPTLPAPILVNESRADCVEDSSNKKFCDGVRTNFSAVTDERLKDCEISKYCSMGSEFTMKCCIENVCDLETIIEKPGEIDEDCFDAGPDCIRFYTSLRVADPCYCGSLTNYKYVCCKSMKKYCPTLPPQVIVTEEVEGFIELSKHRKTCARVKRDFSKLIDSEDRECKKSEHCSAGSNFLQFCEISGLCDDPIKSDPRNMVPMTTDNGECAHDLNSTYCELVYSSLQVADPCYCGENALFATRCCVTADKVCASLPSKALVTTSKTGCVESNEDIEYCNHVRQNYTALKSKKERVCTQSLICNGDADFVKYCCIDKTCAPENFERVVPVVELPKHRNCREAGQSGAASYRGTVSTTKNGQKCVPWKLTRLSTLPMLKHAQNYCRSPIYDVYPFIWCYIEGEEWENCDIKYCKGSGKKKPELYSETDKIAGCKKQIIDINECSGEYEKTCWCPPSTNSAQICCAMHVCGLLPKEAEIVTVEKDEGDCEDDNEHIAYCAEIRNDFVNETTTGGKECMNFQHCAKDSAFVKFCCKKAICGGQNVTIYSVYCTVLCLLIAIIVIEY